MWDQQVVKHGGPIGDQTDKVRERDLCSLLQVCEVRSSRGTMVVIIVFRKINLGIWDGMKVS